MAISDLSKTLPGHFARLMDGIVRVMRALIPKAKSR